MRKNLFSPVIGVALTCGLLFSCSKQDIRQAGVPASTAVRSSSSTMESPIQGTWKTASARIAAKNAAVAKTDEYYKDYFSRLGTGAVAPSECSATPFDAVVDKYIDEFGPLEFALYGEYAAINQLSTIIDESPQYFGAQGEYSHLVTRHQRKLESFWGMPDEVQVNGEHNATLDNRDRIAQVYILFGGASKEEAYSIADEIIAINAQSPVFTETPLLSFDGFATPANLIVIGDGLVQALAETGVVDDIVIAGILSHEWGHQVQFNNSVAWFGVPAGQWPRTPEFTRQTELEADFFSSYFLTHKRGGTFNWKRVAEFNELFFNIGDCAFTNSGHHGTPKQRQAAARLGYTVASETQPKGHILSAAQLHEIFLQNLNSLL